MINTGLFLQALMEVFRPGNIYLVFIGVPYGIICGALPGFSATMAVAIILPVSFYFQPMQALILLACTYAGASYGGSITAILINTPGTPEAAATTLDGYPMCRNGRSSEALGASNGGSFIGGLLSYLVLIFLMYPLAQFALLFGSAELFLLAIFGLSILAYLRGETISKGYLAGMLGILLGTIGTSVNGALRGTFGIVNLMDGLPTIPVLIGMLAFSELFFMAGQDYVSNEGATKVGFLDQLSGIRKTFTKPALILKSTIIGTIIGAIPAVGGSVASFVAYNEAKRSNKGNEVFGQGAIDGVIAPEVANNACSGGALATMFALGIPGSSTTAIIMGAMMLHGMTPGPRVLVDQLDIVYAVLISLLAGQFVLLIAGLFFSYATSKFVLNIKTEILVPIIAVLAICGTFSIRNSLFDVWIMLGGGVLSWLMRKSGFPPIATVLGVILGGMADNQLTRTYIRYRGDFSVFITRPLCIVLILVIFLTIFSQPLFQFFRSRLARQPNSSNN